jgi:hypothetical protein
MSLHFAIFIRQIIHIFETLWVSVCGSRTWGTDGRYTAGKSCIAVARRGIHHVAYFENI